MKHTLEEIKNDNNFVYKYHYIGWEKIMLNYSLIFMHIKYIIYHHQLLIYYHHLPFFGALFFVKKYESSNY